MNDSKRYQLEVWTKIHQGAIYFAVRADTANWIAMLFKDFEHHGMIGDFNDAKLMTRNGIEDYFLTSDPGVKTPRPRFTTGVHTWMASGFLVKDQKSNLLGSGFRSVGSSREYEFAFPLTNEDQGDTAWEDGRAYLIAFLVGQGETFEQVTPETWISDQVSIRIGRESRRSIYVVEER